MTTQQAIQFFGSVKALAQALDIYPQAVMMWGDYPPRGRQYEIEVMTSGSLKAEPREAANG